MKLEPFPHEYKLMGRHPYRLRWSDVWEIYRNNEIDLDHWKKYYRSQGYRSWEEWREKFFRRFGMRHLDWEMFDVTAPWVVSHFRGADFNGWRKMTGEKHLTFGQMAMMESVQQYEPLRDFINNFPLETTVIGIRHKGCIFIVEGMHRCASYSLALREGNAPITNFKLVLGRKTNLFRPMFLGRRL